MKITAFTILLVATYTTIVQANYVWKDNAWVFVDSEESKTTSTNDAGSGDYKYEEDESSYGNVRTYEGSGSEPRSGVPSVDDEDSYQGSGAGPDTRGGYGSEDPGEESYYEEEDDYVQEKYVPDNAVNSIVNYKNTETSEDISFEPPRTTQSPPRFGPDSDRDGDPSVFGPRNENESASFFAQPGILAAVVGGAVVGLLCAILFVMFIVYRMKKKDEGSYALDETKRSPNGNPYSKSLGREIYA